MRFWRLRSDLQDGEGKERTHGVGTYYREGHVFIPRYTKCK